MMADIKNDIKMGRLYRSKDPSATLTEYIYTVEMTESFDLDKVKIILIEEKRENEAIEIYCYEVQSHYTLVDE